MLNPPASPTPEPLGSTELLRTVVSNAPIVLFAIDTHGIFTLSEGKGLELLGLKPGVVVGKSVYELYGTAPQILDQVRRALSGEPVTATVFVEGGPGAGLTFETRYIPIRDPSGVVSGLIGVSVDITARLKAERALEIHLQNLEGMNARLEDQRAEIGTYYSLVTHDVTNTCAVLQGLLELLKAKEPDPLTERQMQLLRRAERQAFEMGRLAENAKTLARIREKGLPPVGQPLSLYAVIRRAAALVRTIHFDQSFEVEIHSPEDLRIVGVPFAENIFLNLIDNAVRHGPDQDRAPIRILAHADQGFVLVRVQGGSALDQEVLAHLFDRYARGPKSTGSGLALALIREILQRVGGSVEAANVATPKGRVLEVLLSIPRS